MRSGAAYRYLPTNTGVGGVRAVARAAPKSISFALPLVEMMTLSGLMSRCTRSSGPRASAATCTCSSASQTSIITCSTVVIGRRSPRATMRLCATRSVTPGTYSIAMK